MRRKKPSFRIATMNVSASGFRCPRNNRSRIQLALKILDFAKRNKISCLCFPSGFLTTSKIAQIDPLLVPITEKARELRTAFVLGVDLIGIFRLSSNPNGADFLEIVAKQEVPCLLASYTHRKDELAITRQRSCTGEHARRKLVPDEMTTPRIMDLGSACFQTIHCGEVYDRRLFSSEMPKAGIVFGHLTMPRLSRTLRSCSEMGFSLVNSEHRIGRGGLHFCYDRGRDRSFRNCGNCIEHGDLWAEIAVWELTDRMRFKPVHDLRD